MTENIGNDYLLLALIGLVFLCLLTWVIAVAGAHLSNKRPDIASFSHLRFGIVFSFILIASGIIYNIIDLYRETDYGWGTILFDNILFFILLGIAGFFWWYFSQKLKAVSDPERLNRLTNVISED